MPDDTLQGLCLRYGCSVVEVRRMNNFSGNSIQFKKTLTIPMSRGYHMRSIEHTPEYSQEISIQQFRNATGENVAEARVYLEDTNFDLDAALAEWRNDEQWERAKCGSSVTACTTESSQRSEGSLRTVNQDTIVHVGSRPMRMVAPTCVVEMSLLEHS